MGYIIKDNPLWDISDDIIIYLTDSQVDMIKKFLEEAARKKGMVKDSIEINNYLFTDGGKDLNEWIFATSGVNSNTLKSLGMIPAAGDANTIAKTDANYSESALSEFKSNDNPHYFVAKIKKWQNYNLISKEDYNSLIEAIVLSSPAAHNDWVYSLSGEKDSKQGRERITLDIHDRRIDDPNFALVVRGGVTVGDPENPQDRKKMTVLGETELQDGTAVGRLLDTYGEKNPMEFGHQIPDHGKYPKAYMNRGEDRYNGENWDDGTYGLGQGTIEAYKEIVSHTTVSADRGMIIEDGVGDPTDRVIKKTELNYYFITYDSKIEEYIVEEIIREEIPDGANIEQVDELPTPSEETAGYYVIEKNENSFDPIGEPTHQTEGFALSIHHDGAKIQGHTYIQDEGSANLFFIENDTIYKANASSQNGFDEVDNEDIKTGCWFCTVGEDEITDSQYQHFCMNKNGEIEPIEDKWPGHLYYEGTRTIKGKEGWKYCCNGVEYYYDGTFHIIENIENKQPGEVFTIGRKLNTYYKLKEDPLDKKLKEYEYDFDGVYTDISNDANTNGQIPIYYVSGMVITENEKELEYTANIRVIPETNKVYKINTTYTETKTLYSLINPGTYEANTYLYWDGNKFKPITESRDSYNRNQDYGSLTIGTRANGEQDNDTIGRNSLEVGSENEATGNNSAAIGTGNVTTQDSQVLIGKYADGANDAIPEANYTEEEETSCVPRFAVGIGDLSESKNGFVVSENGDVYVAGHEQVDGTSDLRKKVTVGDSVNDHEVALKVLKHSIFDQNVTIKRDGDASFYEEDQNENLVCPLDDQIDWGTDNSLNVKGQSLFGDTLTIGQEQYKYYRYINNNWEEKAEEDLANVNEQLIHYVNKLPTVGENNNYYILTYNTFYENIDQNSGYSKFTGLEVFGEIRNPRIPNDLYTSQIFAGEKVYNEFADKFFVNSSIATNTASFLGNFSEEDYGNQDQDQITENSEDEGLEIRNFRANIRTWLNNKQWNGKQPDNNDYCFIQLKVPKQTLPYVLFDTVIIDGEEGPREQISQSANPIKTVVYRYKFVQTIHPTTGVVVSSSWEYEYQLNDSGFTMSQWNALNSGVTKQVLARLEARIKGEGVSRQKVISNLSDSIAAANHNIDINKSSIIALLTRFNTLEENIENNYVTKANPQTITGLKTFQPGIQIGKNEINQYSKLVNGNVNDTFTLPSLSEYTQYYIGQGQVGQPIYNIIPQGEIAVLPNTLSEIENDVYYYKTQSYGTELALKGYVDLEILKCADLVKKSIEGAVSGSYITKIDGTKNSPDEISGVKKFENGIYIGNDFINQINFVTSEEFQELNRNVLKYDVGTVKSLDQIDGFKYFKNIKIDEIYYGDPKENNQQIEYNSISIADLVTLKDKIMDPIELNLVNNVSPLNYSAEDNGVTKYAKSTEIYKLSSYIYLFKYKFQVEDEFDWNSNPQFIFQITNSKITIADVKFAGHTKLDVLNELKNTEKGISVHHMAKGDIYISGIAII